MRSLPVGRARARRRWLVLAAFLSSGVAGCSLATALDGLYGGGNLDDGGADAAPPVDTGDVPDAVTDAGGGGDRDVADAEEEAGIDADTRRWCERQDPAPKLCEDFDDPSTLAPGWTEDPGGVPVTRTDDDARSAPYALAARTEGRPPGSAFLRRSIHISPGRLRTAFDVRVDRYGDYAEIGYIGLRGASPDEVQYLFLELGARFAPIRLAYTRLEAGDPKDTRKDLDPTDFAAWKRVELEVDLESAPAAVTARIDGKVVGKQTLDASLTGVEAIDLTIGTGYSYADGSGYWRILFDNFTAEWE